MAEALHVVQGAKSWPNPQSEVVKKHRIYIIDNSSSINVGRSNGPIKKKDLDFCSVLKKIFLCCFEWSDREFHLPGCSFSSLASFHRSRALNYLFRKNSTSEWQRSIQEKWPNNSKWTIWPNGTLTQMKVITLPFSRDMNS